MNEAAFRTLIRGQRAGVTAGIMLTALKLASIPYGAVSRIRNTLYCTGIAKVHRVAVPVISIGNITTGGTGKTPIVALTCQLLQDCGCSPGIVSRGYRSFDGQANDEKRVLSLLCPDVPHEQNPNRVAAAESILRVSSVSAIVMDDGFQHRRIHRDLNVVLIDATNPFGYGHLLPRGLLREPLTALRRADVVLITRSDLVSESDLTAVEARLLHSAPQLSGRVLRVAFRPSGLRHVTGEQFAVTTAADHAVFLMSGIGNPEAFADTCRNAGLQVSGNRWFPDHHDYSNSDLAAVIAEARQQGAVHIVTTLKDLVKLGRFSDSFLALDIVAVFPIPEHYQLFLNLIKTSVSGETDKAE